VCLSWVRDASDVHAARDYLDSIGLEDTKLLAKISTRHSLYEFQGILNTADGIVLSRGSLGLDNHPEKMAILQKMVVKACNLVGKPVLITRLVDTMINAPRWVP
jgi:pyruvate kinase